MEVKDLLNIDVSTLAEEQHKTLTLDTKQILQKIIGYLDSCDYKSIESMLCYSGSGDGYGDDNHYIDFLLGDIEETIRKLETLAKQGNLRHKPRVGIFQ